MKSINIFAIIIACLITTTLETKAMMSGGSEPVIPDNRQLYSTAAIDQSLVLSTTSFYHASFYLDLTFQGPSLILCESHPITPNELIKPSPTNELIKPSPTNQLFTSSSSTLVTPSPVTMQPACEIIPGETYRTRERLSGAGRIYYLNSGETIVSYTGHSDDYGAFTYEVKYDKLTAKTPKESKVVSERGLLMWGINLDNQYVNISNHTANYRGRTYNRAAINTFSKTNSSPESFSERDGGIKSLSVYARAHFDLTEVRPYNPEEEGGGNQPIFHH